MGHYLSELSRERLEVIRDRKLTIRVRYEGTTSNELHVRHDVLLGSLGGRRFRVSSLFGSAIGTGQDLSRGGSGIAFDYDADTPLARTIFADGDIIEAYVPI